MPFAKLALELGPLILFFLINSQFGIYNATAVFMVAIICSLIASKLIMKKLPIMAMVSGVLVMVFGGFTLYLHNPVFIMIKPTILYMFFAVLLGGGLFYGQLFIKVVLDGAIELQEEGWRKLTFRFVVFCLALALLNEAVWRTYPEWWAAFKLGILPITFLFMVAQAGLLQKYQIAEEVCEGARVK